MSCSLAVDLGQFVVTGEPVAVMGRGAQSAVAKAGGASQPVLYVEFRKDGVPVDPGPWWAANEGQKVRGYHAQNFPDSPRCGRRRGRDADRASLQSNSMIFAALTTGKIAQVSFLATTPGRSSFLLDRESALKACPLHTDLTF